VDGGTISQGPATVEAEFKYVVEVGTAGARGVGTFDRYEMAVKCLGSGV
jgi:hypothetical protein